MSSFASTRVDSRLRGFAVALPMTRCTDDPMTSRCPAGTARIRRHFVELDSVTDGPPEQAILCCGIAFAQISHQRLGLVRAERSGVCQQFLTLLTEFFHTRIVVRFE